MFSTIPQRVECLPFWYCDDRHIYRLGNGRNVREGTEPLENVHTWIDRISSPLKATLDEIMQFIAPLAAQCRAQTTKSHLFPPPSRSTVSRLACLDTKMPQHSSYTTLNGAIEFGQPRNTACS